MDSSRLWRRVLVGRTLAALATAAPATALALPGDGSSLPEPSVTWNHVSAPRAHVQLIFWGSDWVTVSDSPTKQDVEQGVDALIGGNYFGGLSQYGIPAPTRVTSANSFWLGGPTAQFAQDPPTSLGDPGADSVTIVSQFVKAMLANPGASGIIPPTADPQIEYVVVLPRAFPTCCGVNWTTPWQDASGGAHTLPITWVSNYQTHFIEDISHELAELLSRETNVSTSVGGSQPQIADVCPGENLVAIGAPAQSYWSQALGACVVPTGAADWAALSWPVARSSISPQSPSFQEPVNGPIVPVVATSGNLVIYTIGSKLDGSESQVYYKTAIGDGPWNEWQGAPLPSGLTVAPSRGSGTLAVANQALIGGTALYVIGSDGAVWTSIADAHGVPGSWTSLGTAPGDVTFAGALAATYQPGFAPLRPIVFARGTDSGVWCDEGSGWINLQGTMCVDDTCASPEYLLQAGHDAAGNVHVFAQGFGSAVYQRAQTSSRTPASFTPWTSVDTNIAPAGQLLTVANEANGQLELFAQGTDTGLWHILIADAVHAGWSAWSPLGGTIDNTLAAVRDGNGDLQVFVRGTVTHMMHSLSQLTPNANNWQSTYSLLYGSPDTYAGGVMDTSGNLHLFVRSGAPSSNGDSTIDHSVFEIWQPSPGHWY